VEPPEPLEIAGEQEWEVEELLAVRLKRGKFFYRVKWEGADEDPEEYPAGNFKYCPHKVRDFHLANPTRPGPPAQLLEWLKAWEKGLDSYEELDNSNAMDRSSRASFFKKGG